MKYGLSAHARSLASLANAPFVKVEATKFTEVGYVGKDVESIVRDLVETSVKQCRETEMTKVAQRAMDAAEERVLDALLPSARGEDTQEQGSTTRQVFRKKLREGDVSSFTLIILYRNTGYSSYCLCSCCIWKFT